MSLHTEPEWATRLRLALTSSPIPGTVLGQLATIRASSSPLSGRPACRTVNIRKFDNNFLYFISDLRSGKAADIVSAEAPFAEICCYFPEQRLQFRLSGKLTLLSRCYESNQVWNSLADRERVWWAWPTPVEPRSSDEQFDVSPPSEPPSHFCVCKLQPDHVDLLDLSTMPFLRYLYHSSHSDEEGPIKMQWTVESVNP